MADSGSSKPKRRQLKQAETIQNSKKSQEALSTGRKSSRRSASIGLAVLRMAGKLLSPLAFLLWPLKTKPARFMGRVLAVVLLINFVRSSFRELRDVVWPNRRQTTQLTLAVFVFAIVFGIIISVTDYGLDKIFKQILLK